MLCVDAFTTATLSILASATVNEDIQCRKRLFSSVTHVRNIQRHRAIGTMRKIRSVLLIPVTRAAKAKYTKRRYFDDRYGSPTADHLPRVLVNSG